MIGVDRKIGSGCRMRNWFGGIAMAILAIVPSSVLARPLVVAYVPNWIELETFAETIPYEKVTHLNVAFENPVDDAGTLSFDKSVSVLIEKAHAKKVKVLISIGGGSASGDATLKARYAGLLSTPETRGGFSEKLLEYVKAHDFDGLDVDLEGPSIDANYGEFIAELGKRFKPSGKVLTAALSKGYGGERVPDSVFQHFDFVNIMAYDGAGYWSPDAPGQHSSFEFAADNTRYWLKRGLPKEKAVLGLPFYGYGFGKAFKKRDYPYATIVNEYAGAEDQDEIGSTIYYNGLPTTRKKCVYALKEGLAGVMIWSLDSDVTGPRSLLSAIHQTLQGK
ncbi:MAG: hypothetical protein EOP83_31060 [Verrucomicrobiaceae bacterium]|nr:MAG: hypothetical protein EOP83_31060 [Verrucomicrobiaceae bacterium]